MDEIIKALLEAIMEGHDMYGQMTSFQPFYLSMATINRRYRTSGTLTETDFREAIDEYQEERTTEVLQRARQMRGRFDRMNAWRPSLPTRVLEEDFESIGIATEDYGSGSSRERDAINHYVAAGADYRAELAVLRDRAADAYSHLWDIQYAYRGLARNTRRAAEIYGELVDHPAFRVLPDLQDLRADFLAAYLAFDELASLSARIETTIGRLRAKLDSFRNAASDARERAIDFIDSHPPPAPQRRSR